MGIKDIRKKIEKLFRRNSSGNFTSFTIPLQIRIGVTGHRNIQLTVELKMSIHNAITKSIKEIINPKRKELITPLSYKIITPLADGTDRIVAVEALQVLNAEMEVILPFLKEEYVQTFLSPESVSEFEDLLKKAARVTTLISRPLLEQFPGTDLAECRRTTYHDLGNAVINNCDILIAIWDGISNGKDGGTSEVVANARKQKKPLIIISKAAPHKIYHETGDNSIKKTLIRCEFFNSYKPTNTGTDAAMENEISEFFPPTVKYKLNEKNITLVKEKLLPFYFKVSQIAQRYQNLYKNTGLTVYVLSPLAVASVALGTLVHHLSWLFFPAELLILIVILSAILNADRRSAHKKWIQNRYLAELIRIASFITASGFKPTPINIPFHLRIAHRSDDWMVRVYDEISKNLTDIMPHKNEEFITLLNFINEYWIKKQYQYHTNKLESFSKKSKRLERIGEFVFALALIAAAVHSIPAITGFEFRLKWILDSIIFAAIALPALGASVGAIRSHREYFRIAKRSESMAGLLNELLEESKKVSSMNDLKNYMATVEEIMLHESQDWLMLMKFVKLKAI